MSTDRVFLGLTGSFGSGCTEVAKYLKSKPYQYISLSKILEEEAKKINHPFNTRAEKQEFGKSLRR